MGWGRLVAIVAVFVVIGPPVGALAFSVIGGLGAWLTGQPSGTAGMIFYGGILGVVLSWFVGGVQAGMCGLLTALFDVAKGRLSVFAAMVAGLACGIVYVLLEGDDLDLGFTLLLLTVHVVAAGVCAVVAKLVLGPTRPAAA
jgi:hypothetical protein